MSIGQVLSSPLRALSGLGPPRMSSAVRMSPSPEVEPIIRGTRKGLLRRDSRGSDLKKGSWMEEALSKQGLNG